MTEEPVGDTPEDHPDRRADDRFALWDRRVRDILLYVVGIGGVINELFVVHEPRVYALVFLASILGIPFVLRQDEKRRGG